MTKEFQKKVDKVVEWSDDSRLTLYINKFEVSFLSLCTAETSWQPHITIRDLPLSFNGVSTFFSKTSVRSTTQFQLAR